MKNYNANNNVSILTQIKTLIRFFKIGLKFSIKRGIMSKSSIGIDQDIIDLKTAITLFSRKDYYYEIVDDYDSKVLAYMYNVYRNRSIDFNTMAAVTIPLDPNVPESGKYNGLTIFSRERLNNLLNLFGDIDENKRSMITLGIVAHEFRHSNQYEYLRGRGGIKLIAKLTDKLKFESYENNILEIDARCYQQTLENIPFQKVFANVI